MEHDVIQEEIDQMQRLVTFVLEFAIEYGFQIVGAMIILIIGLVIAKYFGKLIAQLCQRWKLDITITQFLSACVQAVITVFVVIMALSKFGISMTPFVAAIGGMVFGGSLALQGVLANYAAGLFIIFTRPFVVGNTLKVRGEHGQVEEIKLAVTVLVDENQERISIPNQYIVGEIYHNSYEFRMAEAFISIGLNNDAELAIQAIKAALEPIPQIARQPAMQIGIQEFGEYSIRLGLRYWIPTKQYFNSVCEVNMAIHKALKAANIAFPIPQNNMRLLSQPSDHPLQPKTD